MRSLVIYICLVFILSFGPGRLACLAQAAKPDDSRFTKVVLDGDLNEPMKLEMGKDNRLYYIERGGALFRLDLKTNKRKLLGKVPVRFLGDDGLMGMALDPGFLHNHLVYFYIGDNGTLNGDFINGVVRYQLAEDSLIRSSRKSILQIPVFPGTGPHRGGSLAFDKYGNLYIAVGDDTYAGKYAPIDDRTPVADAQRTAGNTNDLRGKILRIHPEPDGSYTIPPGNLFVPGTPLTRPEIYVMGVRQPYRIALDQHNDVLYWGEVGPDAGKDSLGLGPAGFDEFNRAARAGNFGWPYFIANSQPYNDFNYRLQQSGPLFDPAHPINSSPNNTGLKELPPVNPALVYYPYFVSATFPELGKGGRAAIGGPVYYPDDYPPSAVKLPAYYAGKWFIADWMRHRLFTIAMDPDGKFKKLEPFMPGEKFVRPIDMVFGNDGALYLLAYGQYWKSKNSDAELVRIEYTEGNRAPVAKISASRTVGAVPLNVQFSAAGSFDYDKGDSLTYTWHIGKQVRHGLKATYTFLAKGDLPVSVTVADHKGKSSSAQILIKAGNEPPQITIAVKGNQSFYIPNHPVQYTVQVRDKEDGVLGKPIPAAKVKVQFQHLAEGDAEAAPRGLLLMNESDCKGCHALAKKSVGPSFTAVALRYSLADVNKLAAKVISGGNGAWGNEANMAAHPQLSKEDASEIIRYILSLKEVAGSLKTSGAVTPAIANGGYQFSAKYTDRGGLTTESALLLRSPEVPATQATAQYKVVQRNVGKGLVRMAYMTPESWMVFKDIDMTGVTAISSEFYFTKLSGIFELHVDSLSGPVIGKMELTDNLSKMQAATAAIVTTNGKHPVFCIFKATKGKISEATMMEVPWLKFHLEGKE
jgi:cytochrome c